MCNTCGCEPNNETRHAHTENVEIDILSENNRLATFNRGWLQARNIFAINMVSSPGSGKTSILEKTIERLKSQCNIAVIEGDQQTENDANRIKATGVIAHQINTESGCHLDAHMVIHALEQLNPKNDTLLFIENVGNLVCPAMFDLGENFRTVVISVTEGDDKPLKYPYMFEKSDVCIINKIDLLPFVPCDINTLKENCLKVNPKLRIFEVSAYNGEGIEIWCDFLINTLNKTNHKKDSDFFDRIAGKWDSIANNDSIKIKDILSQINITPGSRVLDVGTGTGILIPYIAGMVGSNGHIVAIDASKNMIKRAIEKYGLLRNVTFKIADIESIQPAGTFDNIILYSVYPHLHRPIESICSLIKHHLAPHGCLLIAHSQNKETINTKHKSISAEINSNELPPIEILIDKFTSKGIKVLKSIDDENSYILILSNKND